jgi:hypothetical protein
MKVFNMKHFSFLLAVLVMAYTPLAIAEEGKGEVGDSFKRFV